MRRGERFYALICERYRLATGELPKSLQEAGQAEIDRCRQKQDTTAQPAIVSLHLPRPRLLCHPILINFRKLRDSNHFPPNIAKLRTPEDPEDAKDFFYEGSAMLAGWTMLVSSLATIAQIFTGVCVQPPSAVGEVLVTGARRNDVFGGERRAWRGRTGAHGGSLRPPCVVNDILSGN